MPNYENNNVKGTLFVTFDVEFPKGELTPEEKESKFCFVGIKLQKKKVPDCYYKFNGTYFMN